MLNRFDNLIELLNLKQPCSIIRLGNVEATQLLKNGDEVHDQIYTNAGFFGDLKELRKWKALTLKAIKNADGNLKVVTCESFYVCDDVMTKFKLWLPTLPYVEDLDFWLNLINSLNTNKLGFVTYFKKDIERQLPKMSWIQQRISINKTTREFRIIKSENTIRGNEPDHKKWEDVLEELFENCMKEDRDIYFVSCGCYGVPLCDKLKSAGKKAIYIGGLLQLIFGIMGKRWITRPVITRHINAHWIYPSEKPMNGDKVEGWCYGNINKNTPLEDIKELQRRNKQN